MKFLKNIIVLVLGLIVLASCEQGIDPITKVAPGTDESAPVINITYPVEGAQIQVPELIASMNITFEVNDDIELKSITVLMDGVEIASYADFKDYRRILQELLYDNVTNGNHVLTITATDLSGKSSTATINFGKTPPYVAKYDGEIFYMPFDGDYMEMISFKNAAVVGSPLFAGQSLLGLDAYAGAADAYLTFPTDGLQGNEFSALFWMKINALPDRAGILVMGAPDDANPDNMNNRNQGFRFFRENANGMQRFKLNAGNGAADSWFDGGAAADVDPTKDEWVSFAFTISGTESVVYIDGVQVSKGDFGGIDWTGCDVLSIMSGAPRFTGWGHLSDESFMDELRLFNKALSETEIQYIIKEEANQLPGYTAKYGEIFYLPFEDHYMDRVGGLEATLVGTPGFADMGKIGEKSYAGALDSYLTYTTDNFKNNEFSAAFWYKVNADPARAGVMTMGPEDTENADFPVKQNLRTSGFRFFREDVGGKQRFKLNVGTGDGEGWFDGGDAADIDPASGNWVHMAFTISETKCVVYFDGEIVSEGDFTGVDWTGCDVLSIGSGAPRFTGWDHLSDLSMVDEVRLFDKALSQDDVKAIMDAEK